MLAYRDLVPLRRTALSFALGLGLAACEAGSDDGPSSPGPCMEHSSVKVDADGQVMGAESDGDDEGATDGETSGPMPFDPGALDQAMCQELCRHARSGGASLDQCDYDGMDGEYYVIHCAWIIGCE